MFCVLTVNVLFSICRGKQVWDMFSRSLFCSWDDRNDAKDVKFPWPVNQSVFVHCI